MKRTFTLPLAVALLFVTAHRLPAPEQSAKPKPKRIVKANGNSESSTKAKTSSPTPQRQAAPNRSPFEGTWVGTTSIPGAGDVTFTFVINAEGTIEHETSRLGTFTRTGTCDGKTMTWHFGLGGSTTFTPNSDGKTAVLVGNNLLGQWSAVFRRTSP